MLYSALKKVEDEYLRLRMGLWLGFAAVFLQIAVFLQPLLPEKYQISPVCETITHALLQVNPSSNQASKVSHSHSHADQGTLSSEASQHMHHHLDQNRSEADTQMLQVAQNTEQNHHHELGHACQYCTVYGHLIMPPELEVKEVLVRIQVRLLAFQKAFKHVYFVLQRLFLIPQGRAPPIFA